MQVESLPSTADSSSHSFQPGQPRDDSPMQLFEQQQQQQPPLFDGIVFFIHRQSVQDSADLVQLLKSNGASRTYTISEATHVFSSSQDTVRMIQSTLSPGTALLLPRWALLSAQFQLLLPVEYFSPAGSPLFESAVLCFVDLPIQQFLSVYSLATFFGARCETSIVSECTHVVCNSTENLPIDSILQVANAAMFVRPEWITDTIHALHYLSDTPYLLFRTEARHTEETHPPLTHASSSSMVLSLDAPAASPTSTPVPTRALPSSLQSTDSMPTSSAVVTGTIDSQQFTEIPPRYRDLPPLLAGTVFYFEARLEAKDLENAVRIWTAFLTKLGAVVLDRITSKVTHFMTNFRPLDSTKADSSLQRAINNNCVIVTPHWLNDLVYERKVPRVEDQPIFFPAPFEAIPGMNIEISVTGFLDKERSYLKDMIEYAGATYSGPLTQSAAILICKHAGTPKELRAREWGIICVNRSWMDDTYRAWVRQPIKKKYRQLAPHPSSGDGGTTARGAGRDDTMVPSTQTETTTATTSAHSASKATASPAAADASLSSAESLRPSVEECGSHPSAAEPSRSSLLAKGGSAGEPKDAAPAPEPALSPPTVVSLDDDRDESRRETEASSRARTKASSGKQPAAAKPAPAAVVLDKPPAAPKASTRKASKPPLHFDTPPSVDASSSSSSSRRASRRLPIAEQQKETTPPSANPTKRVMRAYIPALTTTTAAAATSDSDREHHPRRFWFVLTGFERAKCTELIGQIQALGGQVLTGTDESIRKCTHLLAPKVVRTLKMAMAINYCRITATEEWLAACVKAGSLTGVSPRSFAIPVSDLYENMTASIERAHALRPHGGLFKNWTFFLFPNVLPPPNEMRKLIRCAGGRVLASCPTKGLALCKMPPRDEAMAADPLSSKLKGQNYLAIIAADSDLPQVTPFLAAGVRVFHTDVIIDSLLTQQLLFFGTSMEVSAEQV